VREAREELLQLRLRQATGAVENSARFRALRKEVARCLTILSGQAQKK
jgi:ribosomal protein L29